MPEQVGAGENRYCATCFVGAWLRWRRWFVRRRARLCMLHINGGIGSGLNQLGEVRKPGNRRTATAAFCGEPLQWGAP